MVATIAFATHGHRQTRCALRGASRFCRRASRATTETGRAGRDGDESEALMIYGLADVVQQRRFIEQSDASDDSSSGPHQARCAVGLCDDVVAEDLLAYSAAWTQPEGACGNRDTCPNPPQTGTPPSWCAWRSRDLSHRPTLWRHLRDRSAAGQDHHPDARPRPRHHSPVHGIGKEHDEATWRNVFRQIVTTAGRRSTSKPTACALHLTPTARPCCAAKVTCCCCQ